METRVRFMIAGLIGLSLLSVTAQADPNVSGTVKLTGTWSEKISCTNILVAAMSVPTIDPGKDVASSHVIGKTVRASGGVVGTNGVCAFALTVPTGNGPVVIGAQRTKNPWGFSSTQQTELPNAAVQLQMFEVKLP